MAIDTDSGSNDITNADKKTGPLRPMSYPSATEKTS
jgi:hypothetical protein